MATPRSHTPAAHSQHQRSSGNFLFTSPTGQASRNITGTLSLAYDEGTTTAVDEAAASQNCDK
ncbi:MAG: hypothetical protein LBC89_02515 [Bacteroidales bacterium]|nr:hypothetical protein [Bacteroidales bacterium]